MKITKLYTLKPYNNAYNFGKKIKARKIRRIETSP